MRKIAPASIKKDFVAALGEVANTLEEVKGSLLSDATKELVADSSLLSAAVLWEGFITDLFVAHINRSADQLTSNLKARVVQSVQARFGDIVATTVKVELPKHLPEKDVRALLDPNDYNLSFDSAKAMIQRACEYLPAAVSSNFKALTPDEQAAIDAWHGIRNFLAHRSQSSEDRMNEALAVPAVPLVLRRNKHKVHNAGAWLRSVPVGTQDWRVQHYVIRMKSVAQKL